MKYLAAVSLCIIIATSVAAQDGATTYAFDGDFDDATFSVESAIIGRGLTIDYVSHPGEMLKRTGPDVGSDIVIFDAADIFIFCSAVVSRKMMEADPMNIAYCPYAIFITDRDGEVEIGYRNQPQGVMQEVQALLDSIVQDAIDG